MQVKEPRPGQRYSGAVIPDGDDVPGPMRTMPERRDMSDRFRWNERYSVGVQQFDADHRRMLEIAHELVNDTLRGPLPAPAGEVLDDLIACAREHFAHEEHLLRATDYPHLVEHQREHRRLLEEIEDYRSDFSASKVTADDVARFVADWMFTHIEQEDRKYRDHLNARGYR